MSTRTGTILTLLAVAMAFFATVARGQTEPVATTTIVYDIRPLLRVPGTSDDGAKHAPSTQEVVDAMVKLIQDTVDSDTWRDSGGPIGSIRELQGALIITQSKSAHERIAHLLNQLMEQRMRQVRVRLHWVYVDPDQARALEGSNKPGVPQPIDPAALAKLPKGTVHQQAEVVCFSGQTVTLHSAREHAYLKDFNPVVGDHAVGLDPEIGSVEAGLEARVTPTFLISGNDVLVDVASTATEWGEAAPIVARGAARVATTQPDASVEMTDTASAVEAVIQRPSVLQQTFQTTLRVPVGQLMLVGGMTLEPSKDQKDPRLLLLLVEVIAP